MPRGEQAVPVEPDTDAESLFRRESVGPIIGERETIQFDIKGPKGAAIVSAVCIAASGGPYSYPWSRPTEIKVKFPDGSEIDIPAPQAEPEATATADPP